MKATGIVRRIDDLGRIVIPKEIRRTLRIREGDPLEIYTDSEGGVIFKKYSPVGEMAPFVGQYANILARIIGFPALICDRETVVAAAGIPKKEYIGLRITKSLEKIMESRKSFTLKPNEKIKLQVAEGAEKNAVIAFPILSSGDVIGAVVILSSSENTFPSSTEIKLAQATAEFLGKQIE